MDPISIAVSATSLATFAFRASKAIYTGVDSVKNADATLLQLQSEVDALKTGLESIASTFQSDEVIQLCKSGDGRQPQSTKLLMSVSPLLSDCQKTLEKLSAILEVIDKPGILRKPIKALKISTKSRDIDLIRHQIRSYSSAMQMTLHMVIICISVDGNNQVETLGDKLGHQLESLGAQITDMQRKVAETHPELDGTTAIANEDDTKDQIQHIKECIQAAEVIYSSGTVYAESVSGTVVGHSADVANITEVFGSVLGIDDVKRRRINDWIPAERIKEDRETDTDNDDEDDVDKDLFLARLAVAQKRLKAKEFKAAETQFEACLADGAVIKSLPQHEIVDLKLDLATACRGAGNSKRVQEILKSLLKLDLPEVQELTLKNALAVAYLDEFQLDSARSLADEATRGRKKRFGRHHESYYESLSLLVAICRAQNDHDSAEAYQNLLPADLPFNAVGSGLGAPSNDMAAIKTLSDNGYDINNKKTYFEALDWALKEAQVPVTRVLLERGKDLEAHNEYGETVLFYACKAGFADLVARLLDQGANIKARGRYRQHILNYALQHEAVLKLLLDRGAEIEAPKESYASGSLIQAAKSNNAVAVKILIQRGANIDARNPTDETGMHLASRSGYIEIVHLFLDAGALIDEQSTVTGCTALAYAAIGGHVEVIKLLMERGANPDIKAKSRKTAIDQARLYKHLEAVKVLKAARSGLFKKR